MIKGSAKKHKVVIVLIIVGIFILSGLYGAFVAYLEHRCDSAGGGWDPDYMTCR